ncbi:PREDICTED: structural maintenance of chromosomes flexible hinge domain-containing protein 1-like [Cyprinodon variegatus]|uniref:structural maintenance of chromosomes flexible hinge domain-containing protein 1-like n=1 Tax=Cyprinodon variegatus TaxID=28743 RepID=UPI0007424FC2|nr:PREDICTED: structural maintenance of chromosomes flexible hinge domain-containing protein 1-like [Cyprinodon variegatus]
MLQVNDCRFEKKVIKKTLETSNLDFNGFLQVVKKEFAVPSHETFVLTTTDRIVVDDIKFDKVKNERTLYLLRAKDQDLPASVNEEVKFVPHYNTLTECGTNEYFTEGQKSLPCALAELVDNALSATAKNTGLREIEIRVMFDRTFGKPAIIVLDNGCGMTSKQLNNWAVYRLSKFTRDNSLFEGEREGYVFPDPVPLSLNSDISFFGVGGKRACFHMGNAVRMISKPVGSPDIHELVLSKEEFQKKEQKKEDVYRGTILNRRPGDFSHITEEERFLRKIISEETGKNSFTVVVITGVSHDHIKYLKEDFDEWTRELAHIYHYYIHGVNGNCKTDISQRSENLPRIDILVTLQASQSPRTINLRQVDDDMQTQYINAATDTFEFRAETMDHGIVEGVLRYHPFLYDRETYPKDPYVKQVPGKDDYNDDDDERESTAINQARGKRDIFECYWNGRLIPYTTISDFDWCQRKRGSNLPPQCYNRFSGVLFTDGKFMVNANKLKFMKLEKQLKTGDTIFTSGNRAQKTSKRANIQKEFTRWLQNCHEKFDKEVRFIGYKETVTRPELETQKKQYPWAVFSSIELDGKRYDTGKTLKFQKTPQILYGSVINFLLYGNHQEDLFATGGEVKIKREPEGLYDEMTKVIPITKIDRTATDESIKKHIESERKKLPEHLKVDWPEGNPLPKNAVLLAGTPLGPLKVEILNGDKAPISSRIHTGGKGPRINLGVLLQVEFNDISENIKVFSITAPYSKNGYWFTKIENLRSLGKYTLTLNAVLNENGATVYGGRELPSYVHVFTIKEGNAERFTVRLSSSQRVGVPFDINLKMEDCYGHPTKPPPQLQPELQCSDLNPRFETTARSENMITIKGVKVTGKLPDYQQTKVIALNFDLKVILPGLKDDTKTVKLTLSPGNPHSLNVESNTDSVENGNPVCFMIEVHDEAGNITAKSKQEVRCQIRGLPSVIKDCSTGKAELVSVPINREILNGEQQILQAKFDMPGQKQVKAITKELVVMPSNRICRMELFCKSKEMLVLRNNENIDWQAGGVLENLFYKLYDEAAREVPITAEIASNIKVTWKRDIDQRDLLMGKLPDLHVSTHVQEKHYYEVSYRDKNVSSCFKIVPCPDEPAQLKSTLTQSTLKLGETLSGHIKLQLVDKYDNVCKKLTPMCAQLFSVEAEGLDKSEIKFKWNERGSSIGVMGIRFLSVSPGPRVICFSYKHFTKQVILQVTPGMPFQLKLVSGPEQPLQVLNCQGIPTPFTVQLCDKWGNPSPDKNLTVEMKPSPETLKLTHVESQPMDSEGKVCFTINNLKGSKGSYILKFKGSLNGKSIPGPSVDLILLPDPNKPVNLSVKYDKHARFPAGGTFPDFSVTVLSEEGSQMKTFKPEDLSMSLWEKGSATQPETDIMPKCGKPIKDEENHCYRFRGEAIPKHAGEYTVEFALQSNKTEDQLRTRINIKVVANEPIKLEPECQLETPVVFHCIDISNRILVENVTLKIMDQHGNPAGQDLNGKVLISMKCPDGEIPRSLPLFKDKNSHVQISLKEGTVNIDVSSTLSVGHLAFVADDDAARVISWHLQGDMDCVITTTTQAAQKLHQKTMGNQQVMPLDSILLHQGSRCRPLPHIKHGRELFKPTGNPVFAKDLLIYPHKESCDPDKLTKVFKNLLGDTILMDDFNSATNYRKEVVEKGIFCPTILTRKGDRVSGRGKFGGKNNRAPSIDQLKVFGAPLPPHYYTLKDQIDALREYQALVEKKEEAEKELNDHKLTTFDEMLQKDTEREKIDKELEEIEKELESVSLRPGKRASGSLESPVILSKRPREKSMDSPERF